MMELVVCSGKGGTGKTSLVAGLASLAEDIVLADCDVDAANLHMVLGPVGEQSHPFIAGHLAQIDQSQCLACGTCHQLCRYGAIQTCTNKDGDTEFVIDPLHCEGCGVCVHFCPSDAIDFTNRRCGQWYLSRTAFGPLVHADLDVGAENSGKLVTTVRKQARRLAEKSGLNLVIVDGPPGIGCPVAASLTGADLALMVTEASLSGLHDLKRVAELATHFRVPVLVCINKYDLSPRVTRLVENFCLVQDLPVIGKIPFEPLVNQAQAAGCSLIKYAPRCEAARVMTEIWHRLEYQLAQTGQPKG